jgi:hypothetical protein
VIVAIWRAIAVCAKMWPFREELVTNGTVVLPKMHGDSHVSEHLPASTVIAPETCQKMVSTVAPFASQHAVTLSFADETSTLAI